MALFDNHTARMAPSCTFQTYYHFSARVFACNPEKSFNIDTTFNIIATYAFEFLCKYGLVELP